MAIHFIRGQLRLLGTLNGPFQVNIISANSFLRIGFLLVAVGCESISLEEQDPNRPIQTGNSVLDIEAADGQITDTTDTDDDGRPGTAIITDALGKVSFDAGPGYCCNPLSIQFSAQVATKNVVNIQTTQFEWAFGDGRIGKGRQAQHTYAWSGTYTVTLTANAPDGTVTEVAKVLFVGWPSGDNNGLAGPILSDLLEGGIGGALGLVADAGEDQTVRSGGSVILAGTGSSVLGDNEDLAFVWAQLAGPSVALDRTDSSTVSFLADNPGDEPITLIFQLSVSAGEGATADVSVGGISISSVPVTDRVSVVVLPSNGDGPGDGDFSAYAGPDQHVTVGDTVFLTGLAGLLSNGDQAIEDEVFYEWRQIEGPVVQLDDPFEGVAGFVAPPSDFPYLLEMELTVTLGNEEDTDGVFIFVEPAGVSTTDVLADWRALDPLPKVHYAWTAPREMLTQASPLLYEYARITHAVSLAGENSNRSHVFAAVALCVSINSRSQAIPTSLSISYSPWHRVWPAGQPPTYEGSEHEEEIELFRTSMSRIAGWLHEANSLLQSDVHVSAVLLKSEAFEIREGNTASDVAWNAAIDEKYTAFYMITKEFFTNAQVKWFDRGASDRFTGFEPGDGYSVSLFELPSEDLTREDFTDAVERAELEGSDEVMPWIALAGGYPHSDNSVLPWRDDWNYDKWISWQLGAEINDSYFGDRPDGFAPWPAAVRIAFFPGAFPVNTPSWSDHFIAYVRGAHDLDP